MSYSDRMNSPRPHANRISESPTARATVVSAGCFAVFERRGIREVSAAVEES